MNRPRIIEQAQPRPSWLAGSHEDVIDPDLPIIDPHHHFSDHWGGYYGEDFMTDLRTGHNVVATVFVQCGLGYRRSGPPELFPVGETERVIGIVEGVRHLAEPVRLCAGIVGYADLRLGDEVDAVLTAHLEAGRGRFRGIRCSAARHESFHYGVLEPPPLGLYSDGRFRSGFARLAPLGLSFDAWCYHDQLGAVADLAKAFPGTTIIVDHLGGPLGVCDYENRRAEVFQAWRKSMKSLSESDNVHIKVGGFGIATFGFDFHARPTPPSSAELATSWRPYIESCVEFFGTERCMFEGNYPVDKGMSGYRAIWNAFKRSVEGASPAERAALFHGTAARCYDIAQT